MFSPPVPIIPCVPVEKSSHHEQLKNRPALSTWRSYGGTHNESLHVAGRLTCVWHFAGVELREERCFPILNSSMFTSFPTRSQWHPKYLPQASVPLHVDRLRRFIRTPNNDPSIDNITSTGDVANVLTPRPTHCPAKPALSRSQHPAGQARLIQCPISCPPRTIRAFSWAHEPSIPYSPLQLGSRGRVSSSGSLS